MLQDKEKHRLVKALVEFNTINYPKLHFKNPLHLLFHTIYSSLTLTTFKHIARKYLLRLKFLRGTKMLRIVLKSVLVISRLKQKLFMNRDLGNKGNRPFYKSVPYFVDFESS